jgi:hypothetical protein
MTGECGSGEPRPTRCRTFAVGAKAYAFEGQFALAVLGGPHRRAPRRRHRTAGAAKVRQRVAATAQAGMNRFSLAGTDRLARAMGRPHELYATQCVPQERLACVGCGIPGWE